MTGYLILFSVVLTASAVVLFSGLFDHAGWAGFPARLEDKISACQVWLAGWIRKIRSSIIDPSTSLHCEGSRGAASIRGLLVRLKSQILNLKSQNADEPSSSATPSDMRLLNCRVRTSDFRENGETCDAFDVEICGTVQAQHDGCQTLMTISLLDVTEDAPAPVQVWTDQEASPEGSRLSAFCRRVELGRLPQKVTVLSEWTVVAQIRIDTLVFARKGMRNLELEACISSADNGQELCRTDCTFSYDNPAPGYQDMQENAERTKVLAVALAFAVSAADDELADCEIELIENWARDNILENSHQATEKDAKKLEKVLGRTVAFFREGGRLDTYRMCKEIVELAPVAQRYDILDLCLYVARADGFVAAEELALLKDLAEWLDVDAEKFRLMMEKVLPVHLHEVKDMDAILGLTSDMSREKARRHLNREYSRWNARVTHADPGIQSQADQMLKLITEARGRYTTEQTVH
jgi:tellurite resistance protein